MGFEGVLWQLRARPFVLAASALSTAALVGWLLFGSGRSQLLRALPGLASVSPGWLWLAALAFVSSLVSSAAGWRSCLRPVGFMGDLRDACARYGAGSLANSLLPARFGDAVRVALFARRLDGPAPVWKSGSGLVGVEVARAIVLGALFGCAALAGALPLWPALAVGGVVSSGLALGILRRKRLVPPRLAPVAEVLGPFARAPRRLLRVGGWMAAATAFRLLAVYAILNSFGVSSPLSASVLALAALELSGVFPLTPGNLGVAGGALALALHARGVTVGHALTLGIAFNAVETLVGIAFGAAAVLRLASASPARTTRSHVGLVGTAGLALLVLGCIAATGLKSDFA